MNPRACDTCGEIFTPVDKQLTRKYCSRECSTTAKRKGENRRCQECGTEFWAKRAEIVRGGAKYCSRACWCKNSRLTTEQYAAWADRMSVERRGSGNPAFKHGKDGNRARLSKFSLKLKGETRCRNCGSAEFLQLHHAIPRSMSQAARDEILNGIPLCGVCHMSWHRRGKVVLYRDLFTAEEWAYISSVELVGQSVQAWLDDRYPPRPAVEEAA